MVGVFVAFIIVNGDLWEDDLHVQGRIQDFWIGGSNLQGGGRGGGGVDLVNLPNFSLNSP